VVWAEHCHAEAAGNAVLSDQEVIRCRTTQFLTTRPSSPPPRSSLSATATSCSPSTPQTGEVDAHGPFDGLTATIKADQLRRDFDRGGLEDVTVGVVRLHSST
jgi:hypothetical protein